MRHPSLGSAWRRIQSQNNTLTFFIEEEDRGDRTFRAWQTPPTIELTYPFLTLLPVRGTPSKQAAIRAVTNNTYPLLQVCFVKEVKTNHLFVGARPKIIGTGRAPQGERGERRAGAYLDSTSLSN